MKKEPLFLVYAQVTEVDEIGLKSPVDHVFKCNSSDEVIRMVANAAVPGSDTKIEKIYKFTPVGHGFSELVEVVYVNGKLELRIEPKEAQRA